MKKIFISSLLFLIIVGFSSFSIHKFYVSIYQINYVSEKKMVQITSRIFADDLNAVLNKKYKVKTHLGETLESEQDIILMKKYLLENMSIKINSKAQELNYLSSEKEGNIIICYLKVKNTSKIKTFEIRNTCLLELNDDQQNIMQINIFNKKENILFTINNVKALLKL